MLDNKLQLDRKPLTPSNTLLLHSLVKDKWRKSKMFVNEFVTQNASREDSRFNNAQKSDF